METHISLLIRIIFVASLYAQVSIKAAPIDSIESFQQTLSALFTSQDPSEKPVRGISPLENIHYLPRLIESIKIRGRKLEVSINKQLKKSYLKEDFFAEYEEDINLEAVDPSIAIMPFLLNIIPIVWISGETYSIDCMDYDLFYALKKVKKVMKRLYPKTSWSGKLKPGKLVKNRFDGILKDPSSEIALLFSGGLDSTSSSFHHHEKKQLLITMWGQWDMPLDRPYMWEKRKEELKAFAHVHGHKNSFIRSNYSEFLNWDVLDNKISPEITSWRSDTTEGMGMMGLAAPIMFLKGYPLLVIASSQTWESPYADAGNPFIDNNLHFATEFRAFHDQFDCERIDKLALIVGNVHSLGCRRPYLKVCNSRQGVNCCSSCTKCIPTILGLLALNEEPQAYGFPITTEEALIRAHHFMNKKQDIEAIWALLHIQLYVINKINKGESIPQNLLCLLEIDVSKNLDLSNHENKSVINWQHFEDLSSPTIIVPEYIRSKTILKKQDSSQENTRGSLLQSIQGKNS